MKRAIVSVFLCSALVWPAEFPVRQVVLYKHGVGFFERSGALAAGESARLDFNATDMNDVLKSLVIEEKGGGKVAGLRYDSLDPLSHKLADFPFAIGAAQPLSGMLDQLKGARLVLRIGNDTVSGIIVNGRLVAASDRQPEREEVTLMLDSGELRMVDLSSATGVRFDDPQLQRQFRDYLGALVGARSKEKRSVYIDSTDAHQREIVASYMIPSAVWKSSYRLIFGSSGQPVLEGWAIVDNTSGEDWNKVQLSLVSGRPISFVSQLYAPKYVARPGAELADDKAAVPVVHEGAFAGAVGGVAGGSPGGGGGRALAENRAFVRDGRVLSKSANGFDEELMVRQEAPAPPPAALPQPEAKPSSIVASASAGELGELFEYRMSQPVTIRKDESAMLPFLQQAVEARKLLIYSDHNSQHPTNAAEITNSTGKTLDGGPITVYDGGAYGGEALMETLKARDKRLISYAVDLGTRITEAFDSKQAVVREMHAKRGVLTMKTAAEETRTYTARNVDQKAKTLIIEHPLRKDYVLLNQKPTEKTPTAYRFEIALAPDATQQFAVTEERIYDQAYMVSSMTPELIVSYLSNRSLSDAGRRQLQRIADQKGQVADNARAIEDAGRQVTDLTADEERIRRNIQSLNSVTGQQQQVQNYARQLDAHEQQLAALRDRQAELQKKKLALQSDLDKLIDGLTF